jgi:hypothetical protein
VVRLSKTTLLPFGEITALDTECKEIISSKDGDIGFWAFKKPGEMITLINSNIFFIKMD